MHLLNIWIISNNVYIDQVDSFLHKQERKKSIKKNKKKIKQINSKQILIILVHERSHHISSQNS